MARRFGGLLSLSFNRGFSYSKPGPRFAEMRAIKAHMVAKDFAKIPGEIVAMKRLWPDSAGLQTRRDMEEKLFEDGLWGAAVTIAACGIHARLANPSNSAISWHRRDISQRSA